MLHAECWWCNKEAMASEVGRNVIPN